MRVFATITLVAILSLLAIISFAIGVFLLVVYVLDICWYGWCEFDGLNGLIRIVLLSAICFFTSFVVYKFYMKVVKATKKIL